MTAIIFFSSNSNIDSVNHQNYSDNFFLLFELKQRTFKINKLIVLNIELKSNLSLKTWDNNPKTFSIIY